MAERVEYTPIKVDLPVNTAWALWAAMHDDDDLAADYVNIACIHALHHLIDQVGPEAYTRDEWDRLRSNIREARKLAKESEDEVSARWASYNEPPF